MGVATTHYVVYGVVQKNKAKVKEFFRLNDEDEHMDHYDDNGYREEITPNVSGVHIIEDGMSGDYIVIGKILAKSLEGMDFINQP